MGHLMTGASTWANCHGFGGARCSRTNAPEAAVSGQSAILGRHIPTTPCCSLRCTWQRQMQLIRKCVLPGARNGRFSCDAAAQIWQCACNKAKAKLSHSTHYLSCIQTIRNERVPSPILAFRQDTHLHASAPWFSPVRHSHQADNVGTKGRLPPRRAQGSEFYRSSKGVLCRRTFLLSRKLLMGLSSPTTMGDAES